MSRTEAYLLGIRTEHPTLFCVEIQRFADLFYFCSISSHARLGAFSVFIHLSGWWTLLHVEALLAVYLFKVRM